MSTRVNNGYTLMATCVGAYDDSGVGTGGFVVVDGGRAIEIDKLDSTGLFVSGHAVYRFIRQLKAIVGYSSDGIRTFLRLPDTRDVHDLRLTQDGFVCVNTGSNEISWYTALGQKSKTWQAGGIGDAWHLNCIEEVDGKLYASAFGEFKTHREWAGRTRQAGFIMDVESGEKIIRNLTGPHNPRYLDGNWLVCESHLSTLTIVSEDHTTQKIQLDGFTRGLAYNEKCIFVGESADRKADRVPDYSHIVVLDRKTFQILERIRIPFPEIYEIVVLPSQMEMSLNDLSKFRFDFNEHRIAFLEEQIERLRIEMLTLKKTRSLGAEIKRSLQKIMSKVRHVS